MDRMKHVTQGQLKPDRPAFDTGDQVRVWYRIAEKDRTRQIPFEGLVIRRRGSGVSETFTVRRVTHGEGVERVFPVHAPVVERIDVLKRGKVKRGRLYFLRTKIGKTRIASDAAAAALPTAGDAGNAGAKSASLDEPSKTPPTPHSDQPST